MTSVVRSVLGAALLLTGASAAMAQSANPPSVANQPVQAGAAVAAPNNVPVAYQSVQTAAPTSVTAANVAPAAAKPKANPNISDQSDVYGGHDPNSLAGSRAFWDAMKPY